MSNWQWPGFNHEKKNTGIPSDIHDILLPPYQICTCQGHLQLPLQISSIYKEHIVRLHVLRFRPCLAYGYQKPPQRKIWTIYLSKDDASAFWLLHNVHNIWCPNQHTGTSPKLPAVPMHNPTLESGMEKIGKLMQTFDAIPCHYQSLPIGFKFHTVILKQPQRTNQSLHSKLTSFLCPETLVAVHGCWEQLSKLVCDVAFRHGALQHLVMIGNTEEP